MKLHVGVCRAFKDDLVQADATFFSISSSDLAGSFGAHAWSFPARIVPPLPEVSKWMGESEKLAKISVKCH